MMTNREVAARLVRRARELGWSVTRYDTGEDHFWFVILAPNGYVEIYGCDDDDCDTGLFFPTSHDRRTIFRELTGKDDPSTVHRCTTISFSVLNGMMWTRHHHDDG